MTMGGKIMWPGDTTWINVTTGILAILMGIMAYFYYRKKK
jgi:LPXTG-motif cell wall-anchored protein